MTKKLQIYKDCAVIGVSGPVGLGQRLYHEVATLWEEKKFSGKDAVEAGPLLSNAFRQHLLPEIQAATTAQHLFGNPVASQSARTATVVALPVKKGPCLFQFDQQGAPEMATEDLPFISIGSGQSIADPFLGFLRRLFWRDSIPSIGDGIFAALFTLKHAIEIAPGGIADPKQIITLSKTDGVLGARELGKDELEEHLLAVDDAERALADFRKIGTGSGADAPPPPEPGT